MSTPGDDFADSRDSPKGESSGRVRVSIACQHCRTRKIKCDGEVPCRKCTEAGIICQPGAKRKKRAPSRKDQYIRELEKKLQDLHDLRSTPNPQVESPARLDDDDVSPRSNDRPILSSSALYKQGSRQLSEYQYFGASSALGSIEADAFGPLSRTGSMAGGYGRDTDMEEGDNPGFVNYHGTDHDLDSNMQAVQAQLPPPEVVQLYIDKYFEMVHPCCPLLNEPEFRARVHAFMRERKEDLLPDSFIGTFLMVLCYGEYYASGDVGTDDVRSVPGWRYFLSAYSGVRDGLRKSNIEYMQGVTLQVFYLQAISKLSVAYMLLGSLIRIMQASGMHRAQDLSTPEGVARTNLMNIVYVMEKTLALSLGRPSLIQDFDCDFHTPTSQPNTEFGRASGNKLAASTHLARIAGQIHRLLYSPEAARNSTQTYLQNIERCEGELERWRSASLPTFPRAGSFRHRADLPADFTDKSNSYMRYISLSYMFLLCNVRRANPVLHTLSEEVRVPGMDKQAVDVSIAMIRLIHCGENMYEPSGWLRIYQAFTAAAILYQSLKAKAILYSVRGVNYAPEVENVTAALRHQITALRALEDVFLNRTRGYTGAARYFAQVLRTWIDQFENVFDVPRSSSSVAATSTTSSPPPLLTDRQSATAGAAAATYHQQQQQPVVCSAGNPMLAPAMAYTAVSGAESLGTWGSPTPPFMGQSYNPAQYMGADLGPLGAAALRLATTAGAPADFQSAYNWAPSQGFAAAYGYGPDPPSAVAEDTDFSGAAMFEAATGVAGEPRGAGGHGGSAYGAGGGGGFEVGDLMMPAWMPGQANMPSSQGMS